jgi:NMD protein affecting ribosome stability and mRNA decay
VVTRHALRQRSGIPYEIERQVCSSCRRVLDERPLRRAAA